MGGTGGSPGEPPTIQKENCDKTWDDGAITYTYAEHLLPGRKFADLAGTTAIGEFYDAAIPLPDVTHQVVPVLVSDGRVSAICGENPGALSFETITFVIPPPP